MKKDFTLDFHLKNQGQNANHYYRSKCLELAESVNSKFLIYLDTKFWLILRDSYLQRSGNSASKNLFETVLELAHTGSFVFPISQDVFLEVIKQTDKSTLLATVKLIDALSCGVSCISYEERFSLELKYFFLQVRGKKVHDCKQLVWTKLAYNMGFINLFNKHIKPEHNNAFQKSFIDHMWRTTMSDMIENAIERGGLPKVEMPKMSSKLNDGKFKFSHENSSFKQMFLSEVAGALDGNRDIISRSMAEICENETGIVSSAEELANPEYSRLYRNTIYNIFKYNKAGSYFPTLRIMSGLHAAIRWDKAQKYQDNDLHDIRHAAIALPYCDAFFTEKRLSHMCRQKLTRYDQQFNCSVESSVSRARSTLIDLQEKKIS